MLLFGLERHDDSLGRFASGVWAWPIVASIAFGLLWKILRVAFPREE